MTTTFFWQGGERIEVEHAANSVTIETDSMAAATTAAEQAGVGLQDVTRLSPNLVRANIPRDCDDSMAQLRKANVVHHVYRTVGEASCEYFITETFFVKFKPGTTQQSIDDFLRNERLEVEDVGTDGVMLCRVTDATGRNCLKTAETAASRADVEYAEPNLVRFLERFALSHTFIPSDTLFPQQWHLHAPANDEQLTAGAGVFAADAWDQSLGRREIVVCVADDGCDLSHEDFRGPDKIVNQLNATAVSSSGISYDSNVTPRGNDYHGTPCSGVAVAEQNGVGTVGVAPGCGFLPVRFPLNFTDAQLAKLFEKISREADVVSCSWGPPPSNFPMSNKLKNTVAKLARTGGRRGKGLVICVAAGNHNAPVKDLDNTTEYRYWDGYNRIWNKYSGPINRWLAAHPDVITVSGCTSLKTRSCYSSWGEDINVCAPTNNFDDQEKVATTGRGIVTTDNEDAGQGFTFGSRYTNRFGGTSSATPMVAGVCGLVLSRNPDLTAFEVRDILQDTADKDLLIVSETPVNVQGDFLNGFSLWYGHGKVNAFKAVQAADPGDVKTVQETSKVDLAIPDNSVRVQDSIEIDAEGEILDIRFQLDVEHTYIGDLEIDVKAPDGTTVSLHNHEGGPTQDLKKTFSTENKPGLAGFKGRQIQGSWTCRVADTWHLDEGTLKSWRIVAKVSP